MKKIMLCSFLSVITSFGGFIEVSQASTTITQAASDTIITGKIKAKYAANPLLNPFHIKVSTANGIVTLQGRVNTDMQFEKASALAFTTDNVNGVRASQLKIRNSEQPIADIAITAKVLALLLKNNYIENENNKIWNVKAETKNGEVYMSGRVKDHGQKDRILELIKAIPGVKSVHADLKY